MVYLKDNYRADGILSSKKLEEHCEKLTTVLEQFLFEQKKTIYLKNGISQPVQNSQLELTNIMQITQQLKEVYDKEEQNLDKYVESFENKIKQYSKLYGSLMAYPLHSIGEQLRINLEEYKIAPHAILELVFNLKQMLLNIIIQHIISYDEIIFNELCEREIVKINVSYFVRNTGLLLLRPEKYLHYLTVVRQGITAFYKDFQCYALLDRKCCTLVDRFFDFVLNKIEIICVECRKCFEKVDDNTVQKLEKFPSHIFINYEAFKTFKEINSRATNVEEIGFLFRQMSEKEKPATIIAKETVFRKWYNESNEKCFNLKNPIKTYARIGAKDSKVIKYDAAKLLVANNFANSAKHEDW